MNNDSAREIIRAEEDIANRGDCFIVLIIGATSTEQIELQGRIMQRHRHVVTRGQIERWPLILIPLVETFEHRSSHILRRGFGSDVLAQLGEIVDCLARGANANCTKLCFAIQMIFNHIDDRCSLVCPGQ